MTVIENIRSSASYIVASDGSDWEDPKIGDFTRYWGARVTHHVGQHYWSLGEKIVATTGAHVAYRMVMAGSIIRTYGGKEVRLMPGQSLVELRFYRQQETNDTPRDQGLSECSSAVVEFLMGWAVRRPESKWFGDSQ